MPAFEEAFAGGALPIGRLGPDGPQLRAQYTWLTDDRSPRSAAARALSGSPRAAVRITVAVNDAARWPLAAKRDHLGVLARRRVAEACPAADEWLWVVRRAIRLEDWWLVQDAETDQELWPHPGRSALLTR